jgi:predicted  nucleic acid-binding Zn-ribbon protein
MRKVEVLRDLQAVDTALDQARERMHRIAARWGRREEADAAAAVRERTLAELHHRQGDQHDLELQIEQLRTKIKTNNDKMYGGRVNNPRELSDLSHEVEQDLRLVSDREDRLLAVFDDVAAAETAATTAQATYDEAEARFKSDQVQMATDKRSLDAEIARLTARRQELVALADAASLRLYESLRRTKGGLAVVPITQRTCMGCRIALPSSEEQKARSSEDLVTCSSCGRILFAG